MKAARESWSLFTVFVRHQDGKHKQWDFIETSHKTSDEGEDEDALEGFPNFVLYDTCIYTL